MAEQKEPIRVAISGAAGQIGYSLIPLAASGAMFGPSQPVVLHLLDITPMMKVLEGVAMELEDGAYPLVRGVVATDKYEVAFNGVSYAILVGGFPRKKGMLRKDLLAKNCPIFSETGRALERHASKSVRILVVANPANTNALILKQHAPSIPSQNITAMTRLDMNRARGMLAKRLGVPPLSVKNVAIWGNHSKTQVAYADNATTNGSPLRPALNDDAYLDGAFITDVQTRGAAVIAARGLSSAMSAANGVKDHIHDWHFGTPEGEHVSMSVDSTGNSYGVADGLIFSFPVTIKDGKHTIVDGLKFTDAQKALLKETEKELLEERDESAEILAKAKI